MSSDRCAPLSTGHPPDDPLPNDPLPQTAPTSICNAWQTLRPVLARAAADFRVRMLAGPARYLATSPHWSRFDLPGGVLLAVAIPALRRGSAECAGLIAGRGLVVTVSIRVLGDGGLEYSTTASTWRRRSTPSKQATNVDGRLDAGSMKSSNPNLPLPPTFSAEREIDDAVGPLVSLRRSRDHGQIPDRHCH